MAKRLWNNPNRLKLDTAPWATIVRDLDRGLDRSNSVTKKVTPALAARIIGVIPHRNDAGHKPKTLKDRIKRDQALRTRFEGAVDLLKDFLDATSGFHI